MNKLRQFWQWFDDRTGISEMIEPLAKHPVPPDSKWWYVFGSATLFAFMLQVVTGVGLAFLYQPSTDAAFDSLKYINSDTFGHLLRSIHYWGASAMILLVGLHMIRVYIMAAFKYPREMSWISGVILLFLTVAMGFTGQLLRFDDNGVWSAIVLAEQAGRVPFIGTWVARFLIGGETIGAQTLSRFFAFHVFLIPGILMGLLGLHLFLVIRNGISEPPKAGRIVNPKTYRTWYKNMLKEKGVPFFPNAAWRDMVFGLLVIVATLVLAVIFGAPELTAAPDPTMIHVNPRPDWYMLWIFAMFALTPQAIEDYAIFLLPLIGIFILVMVPIWANRGERSPWRRPWAIGIVILTVTAVGVFWYIGVQAPWSPRFDAKPLTPEIVGNVNPEAKKGAELFSKKACIYCHTISGHGGIRGPNLTDVGSRLTPSQMTIMIVNGGGNMPAFGGTLTRKELDELVSFLKTRKNKPEGSN